jgi:hypothetical protein
VINEHRNVEFGEFSLLREIEVLGDKLAPLPLCPLQMAFIPAEADN